MTDPQPVPSRPTPETSYFIGRDGMPRGCDDPMRKLKRSAVGPGTARPHEVAHAKDVAAGAVSGPEAADEVPRFTAQATESEREPGAPQGGEDGTPADAQGTPESSEGRQGGPDESAADGAAAPGPEGAAPSPEGPGEPAGPEVFRTEATAPTGPTAPPLADRDDDCPHCMSGLVTCKAGLHQYKPVGWGEAAGVLAAVVNRPYQLACRIKKTEPIDGLKVTGETLAANEELHPVVDHTQYLLKKYDRTEGGPVSDFGKLALMLGSILDQQMALHNKHAANDNGRPPDGADGRTEPPDDGEDEDATEAMH
ncbi:MAG: hypothetical protein ACOCUS_00065 [Polyangiales bacterium]